LYSYYHHKGGNIGYDGNKKVKRIEISVVTEDKGLPISRPITRPKMINADKAYDSRESRDYNRMRRIISTYAMESLGICSLSTFARDSRAGSISKSRVLQCE
jgi:hypothetical protein